MVHDSWLMEYKKSTYKKKTVAPKGQYKPKRGKLAPLMSEDEKALMVHGEWFMING
jgi:hypothetical protein